MDRTAPTDHPVHDLIRQRWSPCGFSSRPVPVSELLSLFEAARWAASSYNEQPWRFIVATRDQPQAFERVLSCLVEGNQAWARGAAVLALTVGKERFDHNGKVNAAAQHDIGLAVGNLSLEATARGIAVHQMIGIQPDHARNTFDVPEGYAVFTALAIGYPCEDLSSLPQDIRQRDSAPRHRKPLTELVYGDDWGQPAPWLKS